MAENIVMITPEIKMTTEVRRIHRSIYVQANCQSGTMYANFGGILHGLIRERVTLEVVEEIDRHLQNKQDNIKLFLFDAIDEALHHD